MNTSNFIQIIILLHADLMSNFDSLILPILIDFHGNLNYSVSFSDFIAVRGGQN